MSVAVAEYVWTPVCERSRLHPERGVAALVDGRQVALFLLANGTVRAVDNRDPFSGAQVLSRGIVGTRGGSPTVASPMFKQVFDLDTGQCLDDPSVTIDCYDVRLNGDTVELALG
jgi:nitrite reductase (NADH) small subunit